MGAHALDCGRGLPAALHAWVRRGAVGTGRAGAAALWALMLGTVAGTPASAQQPGEPARGRTLAEVRCATCHAIDRSQPRSPHADAAPFAVIAATPGMTETALLAALRTSHRAMPNLILDDAETRNIIAHILSLKPAR